MGHFGRLWIALGTHLNYFGLLDQKIKMYHAKKYFSVGYIFAQLLSKSVCVGYVYVHVVFAQTLTACWSPVIVKTLPEHRSGA